MRIGRSAPKRIQDWLAIGSLSVLTTLFFWKIALTNLILVGLDVFTYFYPYKAYAVDAIRHGALPLWNPYLFMGVPFLANIQAATFYPVDIPFYWLSTPKMVSYSIVVHVFLGGAFTYLLARRVVKLGLWGALVAGVTFSLSGFLGAQAEHVNQLSVLIWLSLLLWLFRLSYKERGFLYPSLTGLVVAVQFLGGHVQSSYINLFALGCYALYLSLTPESDEEHIRWRSRYAVRRLVTGLGLFFGVALLGGAVAALQLLPTYELSRLSIRGAGLTYRQAVSFSLHPRLLALSLLPSFQDSPFSEYIAYVGVIPLLLALFAVWRPGRNKQAPFFIVLSALGLSLALGVYNPLYFVLYRLVPGFDLFRAPARWLYLYVLGMSILAGLGIEQLACLKSVSLGSRKRATIVGVVLFSLMVSVVLTGLPSPMVVAAWALVFTLGGLLLWFGLRSQRGAGYLALLTFLVVVELFGASRYLAYNDATAPEAFSSMRTAVARLLTDEGVYRILSFTDGSFDPGDLQDIQGIFAGQLPEEAVYDYLVATKEKETLAPNLPLLYRVQSIDGYDGGVLPLERYLEWQRFLLPEEEVSLDGRLQGQVTEIAPGRLLNLFNVKYILTDKVYDVWVDGVYYDLAHRAIIGGEGPQELTLKDLPAFPSTALGVVSHVIDGRGLEQGHPVAEIVITDGGDHRHSFTLRAGEDTAEGAYEDVAPQHQPARIVGHWRGNPAGNDYNTLLEWEEAIYPQEIVVRFLAGQGQLRLRGVSLIDQRTGAHQTLTVSTEGRYRLVHSGDVKIYQNLDVLPRAFAVHQVRFMGDDEAIIAAMQEESLEPGQEVILSSDDGPAIPSSSQGSQDQVSVVSYEPERVVVDADLESPGYLVLTDAYYPGWHAWVDGEPAEIVRADYYFRAVYLPQGGHTVQFAYDPGSFRIGLVVSLLGLLLVAALLGWDRLKS